jgi:hypothetical protein
MLLFIWHPWGGVPAGSNAPGPGSSSEVALDDERTPPPPNETPGITGVFGLEAEDFTYDLGPEYATVSRSIAIQDLYLMMYNFDNPNIETSVSIIRVLETSPAGYSSLGTKRQTAQAEVLYSLGDPMPPEIEIMQSLSGGCQNAQQTNLVRKGGVYVLSLERQSQDDYWYAPGDLDGLLEVDNNGLIHSHSIYEGLNKYDGVPLGTLWSDIEYLYHDHSLRSRFAALLKSDGDGEHFSVVIGRVTGIAKGAGQFGGNIYDVAVDQTIFGDDEEAIKVEIGPSDSPDLILDKPYIFYSGEYGSNDPAARYVNNIGSVAPLNAEGRITLPSAQDSSYWAHMVLFDFAEGMTPDQLRDEIARIREFYRK